MMKNCWNKLKKPFFCLAPMAEVTDPAFRSIVAKYGKPDVMWTEFVSADGLASPGRDVLLKDLRFSQAERPIVAQFFTSKPAIMEKAARLAVKLGFDGIDINLGCPDRKIEKQGAGAALMKNPKLAQKIIRAAQKGAGRLPISIKTRIGYSKNELADWLPILLETEPDAITIHFRARKEMSKTTAHWELALEAVKIRGQMRSKTLLIGNGDVRDLDDARAKAKASGLDGIMIGRAIFGNPWLFNDKKIAAEPADKLRVLIEHAKLFAKLQPHKNFAIMKKHYKAYAAGWNGAKKLRLKLMETKNPEEVEKLILDARRPTGFSFIS